MENQIIENEVHPLSIFAEKNTKQSDCVCNVSLPIGEDDNLTFDHVVRYNKIVPVTLHGQMETALFELFCQWGTGDEAYKKAAGNLLWLAENRPTIPEENAASEIVEKYNEVLYNLTLEMMEKKQAPQSSQFQKIASNSSHYNLFKKEMSLPELEPTMVFLLGFASYWMEDNFNGISMFHENWVNGTDGLVLVDEDVIMLTDPIGRAKHLVKVFAASPNGFITVVDDKDDFMLNKGYAPRLARNYEIAAQKEYLALVEATYQSTLLKNEKQAATTKNATIVKEVAAAKRAEKAAKSAEFNAAKVAKQTNQKSAYEVVTSLLKKGDFAAAIAHVNTVSVPRTLADGTEYLGMAKKDIAGLKQLIAAAKQDKAKQQQATNPAPEATPEATNPAPEATPEATNPAPEATPEATNPAPIGQPLPAPIDAKQSSKAAKQAAIKAAKAANKAALKAAK